MSALLINESPLQVLPSLAMAVGLNEAIVLQQCHYWLGRSCHELDGVVWFYRSDDEFSVEFPFWSVSTLRRALAGLKKRGLIRVDYLHHHFKGDKFDRTKWYTIDYAELEKLACNPRGSTSGQNNQMQMGNMTRPSVQFDQMTTGQNDQMLQEITSEITTTTPTPPHDGSFAMFAAWTPSTNLPERLKAQRVDPALFNPDRLALLLAEFVSYWLTQEGREHRQNEWDHKFVQQITRKPSGGNHHENRKPSTGGYRNKPAVADDVFNNAAAYVKGLGIDRYAPMCG